MAVLRNHADKIFLVQQLSLQIGRDISIVRIKQQVYTAVLHSGKNLIAKGQQIKRQARAESEELTHEGQSDHIGAVITTCDSEPSAFLGRVECSSAQELIEPWEHRFEFSDQSFSFRGHLVSAGGANQQLVAEGLTEPLHRTSHSRLAEKESIRSARHIAFLSEHGKNHEEVEIGLANMFYTHIDYHYYALDAPPQLRDDP